MYGIFVIISPASNGYGFDLPGFMAGRKPCWIFAL
jgi:hypothetical protein